MSPRPCPRTPHISSPSVRHSALQALYRCHSSPVVFLGFLSDDASLVSLDSSGLLVLWPQGADQRSGFGWLKPRARWQLPRMMRTCQLRWVGRVVGGWLGRCDDCRLWRRLKGWCAADISRAFSCFLDGRLEVQQHVSLVDVHPLRLVLELPSVCQRKHSCSTFNLPSLFTPTPTQPPTHNFLAEAAFSPSTPPQADPTSCQQQLQAAAAGVQQAQRRGGMLATCLTSRTCGMRSCCRVTLRGSSCSRRAHPGW